MFTATLLVSMTAVTAFDCRVARGSGNTLRMGLDPVLSKNFPRDFKKIPVGTEYGTGADESLNKGVEARRLAYLEEDLFAVLNEAVATKERPMFTTALIAGDAVILDALHKTGLLSKVPIVFVDTFTLFPETLQYLHEVENHYGFKSIIYNAVDCTDQDNYHSKYGRDYWMKDIDQYDMLCKVRNIQYNFILLYHAIFFPCPRAIALNLFMSNIHTFFFVSNCPSFIIFDIQLQTRHIALCVGRTYEPRP